MHVFASRLLLAAIFAVGLTASAAWAGGGDKPCQGGSHQCAQGHSGQGCKSHACQAQTCPAEPGCDEDCSCDDEGCADECRCEHRCDRCSDCRCQDSGDDDEGDDDDAGDDDSDDDGDNVQCADEDDCCCDGWFFGNWFKGWNASSGKPNCADSSCSPGTKCQPCNPTAQFPYQLGRIYGGAMGCKPMGTNAAGCAPANCWGHPYGVMQAGAAACACKCECGQCQCSKDKQTACPAGGCAFDFTISCPANPGCCAPGPGCYSPGPGCCATGPGCCAMGPGCCANAGPCCPAGCGPASARFMSGPVPPPPPSPVCPVMGPHPEMFHKLAAVMAENAALHARLQAKEDWADEQECLRAALAEARQEVVRLTAAQQNSGNKDQVLVEWIKSQSESSARKDEMLVEIVGAVVEMHTAKSEAAGNEKLEAKIEKLEGALEQVKEENAKLRTQVSQHKRSSKRVSTSTDGASCHPGGACDQSPVYKVETEPVDCPK